MKTSIRFRISEHKTRSARHTKGQYFSFDAIVASVIFILTFIALVSYWFSVKSALESKNEEISREAARISDSLLTPASLQTSYADRKVKESELLALPENEDDLKKALNSPYNVYLVVSLKPEAGGPTILVRGTAPPSESSGGAQNVVKVRRVFVFYNDTTEQPAVLDLYLYD